MDKKYWHLVGQLFFLVSLLLMHGCKSTTPGAIDFKPTPGMVVTGQEVSLSWNISEKFDVVAVLVREDKEQGSTWQISNSQFRAGQLLVTPRETVNYVLAVTYRETDANGVGVEKIQELSTMAVVISAAESAAVEDVKQRWDVVQQSATDQNPQAIVAAFHPQTRETYQELSESMQSQFTEVFASFKTFAPMAVSEKEIQFVATRTINGKEQASIVTFARGYDGEWYIVNL